MLKRKEDSKMWLKPIFDRKANEVSHFGAVGLRLFSDAARVLVTTVCSDSGGMMFHDAGRCFDVGFGTRCTAR
jgi:hypothetical protein